MLPKTGALSWSVGVIREEELSAGIEEDCALAGAGVGGLGEGIMGVAAFVMAGGAAGGIAGVGGLREERIVGPVVGSEPGGSVQDDAQTGNGREGVDAN